MIKGATTRACRTIFSTALVQTVIALFSIGNVDAQSEKFQFAVIGDTSYSRIAEEEFDRLVIALNKENLADFPSTVISFDDELGRRLRPAIDRIETVFPDGQSLGTRTTAEVIALNELDE